MGAYMSTKLVKSSAFQWEICEVDGKRTSSFSPTLISAMRTVRSARIWKLSHLRLFVGQVINRKRNERASYSDDEYLKEAVAWLERAQDATLNGGVSGGYDLGQGWILSCLKAAASSVPTFLRLADEWGNSRFFMME